MKLLLAALLLLALGFLPGCATMENTGQMIAAAKDLDDQFVIAFNRGDVNDVMTHYWNNPQLVMISPDGHITTGYAATRDTFSKMFSDMRGAKLEITDSHYRAENGLVYAWGSWRMTMPAPAGAPLHEMRGVFSQIAARRDGRMVYLLDHPAITLPPPPK